MSTSTVVVNYGAPRSGTTFMRDLLHKLGAGILAFKLAEGRLLHPCKSKDGLSEFHKMLSFKRLVLIRTVRDPMEIVASFIALRNPKLWKKGAKPINVAKFSDEKIVSFVTLESEYTALQRPMLLDPPYVHKGLDFIEVRYEDLADEAKRKAFAERVAGNLPAPEANLGRLIRGFESWGKTPVGPGRLRTSDTEPMDTDTRAWFAAQLSGVIEREGYAG